jgi:hypothetical protein
MMVPSLDIETGSCATTDAGGNALRSRFMSGAVVTRTARVCNTPPGVRRFGTKSRAWLAM